MITKLQNVNANSFVFGKVAEIARYNPYSLFPQQTVL